MSSSSDALSSRVWKRLRRNKLAMCSLFTIAIAIAAALFCYVIAPDNSSNADLQTVEIQARKPGYTQLFLKIPAAKNEQKRNWFQVLISGRQSDFRYVPITTYSVSGDSLIVDKYVDEDTTVKQYY